MISFVIPQKGRLDLLEATLTSIAQQDLKKYSGATPIAVEVVLITQDENTQAVNSLLEHIFSDIECIDYQCLVANSENVTISCLRNRAARMSKGEWLVFLDADIYLSRNWIISMLEELSVDDSRALVSAVQVTSSRPTTIELIQVELNHLRMDSCVSALSGHNLLLGRETFESVGGFPEHLMTCEDSVFTDRVNRVGLLYRSSQASYIHLGEDKDLKEVFKKEKWRSYSNFATLHGRDVRLLELVSFVAPMFVLFSALFSLVALLIGEVMPAIVFALVAMLPVFTYTFRLVLRVDRRLSVLSIFSYYVTYFVARGIGMVHGIGSALRVRSNLNETT